MNNQPFIHLRVHTAYSLCEGAVKVPDLAKACSEFKMPAVAITDTNNMFGVLDFSMKCCSSGIQPIVGTTLSVKYEGIVAPIVLLAKDDVGYRHLLKLMSAFYIKESNERSFVTLADLDMYKEGLIALSGGSKGPAGKLLLSQSQQHAVDFIDEMNSIYDGSFYMEISRKGTDNEAATESFFVAQAMERGVPLVATNEVYFLRPEMHIAHDALLCIADGAYLSQEERRRESPESFFKSSDEMYDLFSDLREAVVNTSLIARRCHYMPTAGAPRLPKFGSDGALSEHESATSAEGMVNEAQDQTMPTAAPRPAPLGAPYETGTDTDSDLSSGQQDRIQTEDEILNQEAYEGLRQRLDDEVFQYKEHKEANRTEIEKEYFERLDFELSVIKKMGYSGYFLIVSDFVKWAKANDIPVGPGRGSGAGSLVAWSVKITDVDPVKNVLIFERFLNPDRVSMPDFDIDFCQSRRDEVIEYVKGKYGANRVAHIIALGKLQARAVVRDVGRVLQLPYGLVDKISKLVPHNPAHPVTLAQALELEPELKNMMAAEEAVDFLINTALQLEGLFRHASIHAAGIVISDQPVDDVVPLYSDGETTIPITQFNMKFAEAAGLVKFDFLGLKTLTLIKDACDNIKEYKGVDVNIAKIDHEDQKTFDLLCSMDVAGVFQLESAGMRDVIQKLQPDRLDDLIALVSLYRPGPMDDIPKYLARKHGTEPMEYLAPQLEPILKNTYGVMVYQEQVMKIAQVLGGYTLAQSDILRRAMGKKIQEEMVRNRAIFAAGAQEKGISKDVADKIFSQMEKFAGYGFNRSHAAPYALLSYQTAYLKANFRREFYVAIMNLDIDNTDKIAMFFQDARQSGVRIFPPDINKSEALFIGEGENDIRFALGGIKGISFSSINGIVEERKKNGEFKNLKNFIERAKKYGINKKQLEMLILAGGLDCLHSNRRQLFESMAILLSSDSSSNVRQTSLFKTNNEDNDLDLADIPEWDDITKLTMERGAIGFYIGSHPMDIYSDFLGLYKITRSKDFNESMTNITVAGILLGKKEKLSKNGGKFAFLTMSDQDNSFEVTAFSDVYANAAADLKTGQPFMIDVTMKMDMDVQKLRANSITPIESILANQRIYLELGDSVNVEELYNTIDSFEEGKSKISFIIRRDGKTIEIETKYSKNMTLHNRKILTSIHGVKFFKKETN